MTARIRSAVRHPVVLAFAAVRLGRRAGELIGDQLHGQVFGAERGFLLEQVCGEELEVVGLRGIGGELYELDAFDRYAVGHGRHVDGDARLGTADLVHEPHQRAFAVGGDRLGRTATELVVEDLQRQRPVIAGRGHRAISEGPP